MEEAHANSVGDRQIRKIIYDCALYNSDRREKVLMSD